ncbi:MAG TPA: SPFH domain-containing protein [Parafilimonas sp.]|nr:SPFH domain-containing protein [Parafilimonas sp.]
MNTKKIVTAVIMAGIIIFFFSFVGCERIDAGNVGIKVNNAGGERGVSKTEYVTGWVFYSRFLSRVYEFPTFQQHKEYDPFVVPSKGGTIFTVHPSFNYNLNPGEVGNMFQTFRLPLSQLEEGYLKNAVSVTIREVTNTFTVDSILNNLSRYDAAIVTGLNKKLAPFFTVSTFTSGLQPDEKLAATIAAKADAIQQALRIENEQKAIRAKAENDIIEARRDSAVLVINALSEARAIREKQNALTPEYVEYQKILKWDGKLPQVQSGNGGIMLQMKQP